MENPWGDERDDEPRPMSPSDVSSSNSQRPYVMSEASREQTRQWMKLHDAEMEVRQRTRKWTRAEEDIGPMTTKSSGHNSTSQCVPEPCPCTCGVEWEPKLLVRECIGLGLVMAF